MQHAKQDPNPTNANSGNRESGKLLSVALMGNKSALGRNAEKQKQISSTIIKENKRYKMEINEIIKTGKAEAVNIAFIEAAAGGNLLVIKKLFKKRGDDIDVNAVDGVGKYQLCQLFVNL